MNQVNKTAYRKHKYSNAWNKSRKRIRSALERTTGETRQKNILRKLNPPPKPEPEDEPEPEVEPEVKRVPSLSQSVEVTGPRSCRLQKCAFRSCPNGAPAAAPHNDGVTLFPFPRKPGQDSKWARRVSRANGAPFWSRLTSRVCQLHFPPELITTDRAGAPALQRGAVPSAEPYQKREVPNITQTRIMRTDMVPNQNYQDNVLGIQINSKLAGGKSLILDKEIDETIQNTLSDNLDTDITVKSEDCDSDEETIQNTLSDNLDTDITVKSEDCNSDGETIQNTLSDNLDTDIIVKSEDCDSDEETIQNTLSDNLDTDITVKSEDCNSDGETIQNTLSDNLDTDIIVKSEDCDSDGETEETIIGEAETSAGIQPCDDNLDETVIVKMEYESDSDNGLKPET